MLLEDKICFITGAGRGIGRAILERFIEEGAKKIYANTLTEGRLDDICNRHANVVPLYFDVSDSESVRKAFQVVRKDSGALDVLVNNAGIVKDELIGMIEKKTVTDVFNVNVFATIDILQTAARFMMKKREGSIINISSEAALSGGIKGQFVYSASKGAIISLTKTAAKELAPYGIRVNAVAPGAIETEMLRKVKTDVLYTTLAKIPLGRYGEPREVADACVFLASSLSSYISGHILLVTGAFN